MDYIFVVPDSPKFDHFFREHMFLNIKDKFHHLHSKSLSHSRFKMSKFIEIMKNVALVFLENQHLVDFLPIMRVSLQETKKWTFIYISL